MQTFLFLLVISAGGDMEAVALPTPSMDACRALQTSVADWLPNMINVPVKAYSAECGTLKEVETPT